MDDNSFASTPRRDLLLCWLALAAYALVVLRSAWLTEDAYITFRTVDHFINGFGLRWNIAERVQTYTNPLWMFFVAFGYLLTGEIFYTAIALSVATSLLAVFFFIRHLAASLPAALLGTALLCSSKGFIDYSTSGLENPLSHLLLATFAWMYLRRPDLAAKLWPLSLLAALAACNRMDTALLYAPALLYAFWPRRNLRAAIALLTGFAPLVLWIGFSLVYYGLGMVEMEMGHAEAAIRALHRVIDLAGDTIDSPPYTEVGIALFSRGDTSGSSRAYALSLAKDPNDLPALINLGWNHYSEGRLDSGGRYDGLGPASAKSNSRRPMGITRWRMYAAVPQAPTPSPISGPSIASM